MKRSGNRAGLPKLLEHGVQSAVVQWATLSQGLYPDLKLLYAIPNGGHRHPAVAVKMKAEGVKPGIPDLHLPVARGGYLSLYVEMKTKDGSVSKDQRDVHAGLRAAGHLVQVCKSIEAGVQALKDYLRLPKTVIQRPGAPG
jgi:hypothetical protein